MHTALALVNESLNLFSFDSQLNTAALIIAENDAIPTIKPLRFSEPGAKLPAYSEAVDTGAYTLIMYKKALIEFSQRLDCDSLFICSCLVTKSSPYLASLIISLSTNPERNAPDWAANVFCNVCFPFLIFKMRCSNINKHL